MWGLLTLLVLGAANAQNYAGITAAPPYVQSSVAFTHARLYLQESVPYEARDITDPEARQHFAFGIVASVTGNIAKNYSRYNDDNDKAALEMLDKYVPLAWEKYNDVSYKVNQLLAETQAKIQPITSLIETLCSTTDSVEKCNQLVHAKVRASSTFIQNRAKFTLAIGGVSNTLKNNEVELNSVVRHYTVIPYLLRQIVNPSYKKFIIALSEVYHMLRNNNIGSFS